MAVQKLSLSGTRNLVDARLTFHGHCNVITGANAAGKTSLLEAIHILARGRSFRAARLDRVRRDGTAPLFLQAEVDDAWQTHRVGVGRDSAGTRIRVDGEDARGLSQLARLLPVQIINTESQRLLQDGPDARRSYLNWTVFHVEHDFHGAWRRFDRALRQRNAALREGQLRLAYSLESELVSAGGIVDGLRRRVLSKLEPRVQERVAQWLGPVRIAMHYRQGWAKDRSFGEALVAQHDSEAGVGYTMVGPQRAELQILAEGMEARERLSRGQQKVLVTALLLAQAEVVAAVGGPRPVLLVDDLPAELDEEHRDQVVASLLASSGQCFFTAIDAAALPLDYGQQFHVEQGTIKEMVY